MKLIALSNKLSLHAIVDDEDFKWLSKKSWRLSGSGYVVRKSGNGKHIRWHFMHRDILEYRHGKIPHGMQVDHENGKRLDNRRSNLRLVTPKQNCANRSTSISNEELQMQDMELIMIKRSYSLEELNFPELHDSLYMKVVQELEPTTMHSDPPGMKREK